MKTVLKATKRFAAVFLALAMVVLGLPELAMPVMADTNVTVTIGAVANATIAPDSPATWNVEGADLAITYAPSSDEYQWASTPVASQWTVTDESGVKALDNDYSYSFDDASQTATITLDKSKFTTATSVSTTATMVAKDGGVSVSPNVYSQSVVAGQPIVSKTFTASINGSGSEVATWGLYTDAAGTEVATIPGVTLAANGNEAVLSGAPTTQKAATTYYVIASNGPISGGKFAAAAVSLTVGDADSAIKVVNANENPLPMPQTLDFRSEEVGYDAVAGKSLIIMNTSANPVPIDSIVFDGADKDAFTVSGFEGTSLAAGAKATLTIAPKTGLAAKTYSDANLLVKSTAFTTDLTVATAAFKVTDDISVLVNGKEATLTDSGLTVSDSDSRKIYDIDLGTYKVGTKISDIVVKATESGAGNGLTWNTDAINNEIKSDAASNIKLLTLGTKSIISNRTEGSKTAAGFTLSASSLLAQATYDAGATAAWTARRTNNDAGRAVRVAYNNGITYYYIPMTVSDTATNNRVYYGVVKVQATDAISVEIDEQTIENGGSYAWTAADPTAPKTVTVKNNSAVDLNLVAAAQGANITVTGGTITVEAGKSQTFTVKAASDADKTDTIKISGDSSTGIDDYVFGLTVTKVSANPRITTPAASTNKTSGDAAAVKAGNFGANYSFTFKAATATLSNATWSILDENAEIPADSVYNDGSNAGGETITGTDVTKDELTGYGLSLNPNTGVLSGTIVSKALDGKIFAVAATIGEKTVVGYYTIAVGGAKGALSATWEAQPIIEKDGIELTSTTDGGSITETFVVTNNSEVNLTGLTLSATAPDAGSTDNKANVTLKWVDSKGDELSTININSHQSATLKMTIADDLMKAATAKTTFGHKVNVVDGTAIYTFPVNVEVTTLPQIQDASGNSGDTIDHDGRGSTYVIKANQEITSANAIALTAKDAPGGSLIDSASAKWEWEGRDGDALPPGLTLVGNKIYGTPTKTGNYKIRVYVTNNTPGIHKGEVGSRDFTLTVAGGTSVTASGNGGTLTTSNATYTTSYLFPGIIAGQSTAPQGMNVTVANTTAVATGAINIKIEDAKDGAGKTKSRADSEIPTGSSTKFELSTKALSSIPGYGTDSFKITPNETLLPGTYNVKVTMYGDGISETSFFTQYTVSEDLYLENVSSLLSKSVGDSLDQKLIAYGAGAPQDDTHAYDENGQGLKWYLNVKKNGVPDKAETDKLITELVKIGFTTSGAPTNPGEISTSWTTGKGYEINGGVLKAANMDGAGEFTFDVYAETYDAHTPASGSDIDLAAQWDEETITMTVAPTSKLYVLDTASLDETDPNYYKYENGSVDSAAIVGSTDKKVTSYTFQNQAVSGYTAADVKDTIKIKNTSGVALKLSASVVNKDKKANTDFTIDNASSLLTAIANGGYGTFDIHPTNVETKEKVLSAYILIEADATLNPGAFTDIMIPVSMTVEPAYYAYKVFEKGDEEELPLNELNLGTIIKGKVTNTTFTMKNMGNTGAAGDVTFTEVMDAQGTLPGSGDTTKLSPIAQITATNMERNEEADFVVTPSAGSISEVGEQEAFVKVHYPDQKTDKVWRVTYTVISNDASAELSPSGNVTIASKKENYNTFAEDFTIKNTGTKATDILKNVKLTLTGNKAFSLDDETQAIIAENGGVLAKSLGKGAALSFDVVVDDGLQEGLYSATVTLDADNLSSKIVANLTFKVTADENLNVEASTAGKTVAGTRQMRLLATLAALAPTNGAGKNGVYRVSGSDYKINLNGDASVSDYDVEVNGGTITVGSNCDISGTTATLTNTEYTSEDLGTTFKKVNFTVFRTVTVNVNGSTGTPAVSVWDGEKWVKTPWETYYGSGNFNVVYEVPNGQSIDNADVLGVVQGTGGTAGESRFIYSLPEIEFMEDTVAFDEWFDDDGKNGFTATQSITADFATIIPKVHTVTYKNAKAKKDGYVSWDWADDYSTATLALLADDGVTVAEFDATVTPEVVKRTCTRNGSLTYKATHTYDGVTFTNEQQTNVDPATGHKWSYVEGSLKWSPDKKTATISLECKCDVHDGAIDGVPKVQTNVVPDDITPTQTDATCIKEGTYKNVATWYDHDEYGNPITSKILYQATSAEISDYGPHSYSKTGTFSWTFPTGGMPTATLNVKCLNAPENSAHDLNVPANEVDVIVYREYSNGDKVYQAYYYVDRDHVYTEFKTVKANGSIVNGDDKSLEYDGLETEVWYNNGKAITQPNLKVYWGDDQLVLNKDYTLTYADNKEVGSATVTITGKGNYAETKVLNYRIVPADLTYTATVTAGVATKTAAMPYKETTKPKLAYGGKTLKQDTDYYVVDPNGEGYGYDENGVKTVTLKGIGNYTGSLEAKLYAVDNKNVLPASKLTVTIDAKNVSSTESYERVYPNSITIKYGKNFERTITNAQMKSDGGEGTIGNDGDTVKFNYVISNNYVPGTAGVTIYTDELITVDSGKQMIGSVSKTFKIAGQNLAKAAATYTNASGQTAQLTNKTEVPYLGRFDSYTTASFDDFKVSLGTKELEAGKDYYMTYKNCDKAGTATFTAVGTGAYTGSKANFNFKITKPTLAGNTEVTVAFGDGQTYTEVPYVQGGAKPSIMALCTVNGELLVEGTDYTLSYKNNTKVNQIATVTVTGKGNYQGKNDKTLTFKVTPQTLTWTASGIGEGNTLNYTRTDVKFNSSKVMLYDNYLKGKKPVVNEVVGYTEDGFEIVKKLTENRDYTFTGNWFYADGTAVGAEDYVDAEQIYTEGLVLYAEIIPGGTSGNYTGEVMQVPSVYLYGTQLKANMIEVNQNIFYTGDRITQESVEGGIITNLDADEFEILGYKNNVNQGTGTVTVRGWGPYGGTVNKTFRIQKANVNKQ